MPALSFKFARVSLGGPEAQAVAPTGGALNVIEEDDLAKAGLTLASREYPDEYAFSRMGGWNVAFRASVIRVTFFKLLGTGVAAFLMSINPHTGRYTSFSCAISAAVNFIACGHYFRIWNVRQQTFGGPRYDKFMSEVGRAPFEDKALLKAEAEDDERRVYFQEVTVDGLRFSDWLCTLGTLRKHELIPSRGLQHPYRHTSP